MYTHLLLPTDGSQLSSKAVDAALGLAKPLNARVTALYVTPKISTIYGQGYMYTPHGLRTQFTNLRDTHARKLLAKVRERGKQAGVSVETERTSSDAPFEAILRTAERLKCDLIVMASHGRRGLSAVLLGSETLKVLTHSRIPVLVLR